MRACGMYTKHGECAFSTRLYILNIILNNAYRCFVITSIYYIIPHYRGYVISRFFLSTKRTTAAYNILYKVFQVFLYRL
jgi:hypothetical protein